MKMFFVLVVVVNCLQISMTQTTDIEYGDVVFLVDSSSSMGNKAFNQAKAFLAKTITQLPVGLDKFRIGLAQYSDDMHVEFLLNTYKTKNPILNYLKKKFNFKGGSSQTGNAIAKVHETFFKGLNGRDKSQFPPVLVVILSGSSLDDIRVPCASLRDSGVRVISLGLPGTPVSQLHTIASDRSFAFQMESVREMIEFSDEMANKIHDAVKPAYSIQAEDTTLHTAFPALGSTTDFPDLTNKMDTNSADVKQKYHCKRGVAADIAFLIDTSRHTPAESENVKKFLNEIISGLEITSYCVHVGMATYSSKANIIASFAEGTNKTLALQFANDISPIDEDTVNTGAAIDFTREFLFDEEGASRNLQGIEQIAVLVTHSSSSDSVSEAAHLLRNNNVRVFAVGIAKSNKTQLSQIVSYPTDRYLVDVKTFADLPSQAETLLKKIQNVIEEDIITSARKTDLLKDGCLATELADLYLLIDGSENIHPDDFRSMKMFLMELVEMFNLGPHKVRVAAVQYSNVTQLEFGIWTEYSKTDLKSALINIRQLKGEAFTGAAINYTHEIIMDPKNAREVNVSKYLIVLTGAASQDSVKEAAQIVHNDNINVYAIGVKDASETQLFEIAHNNKMVHFVQDYDSLKDIKNQIARQICSKEACSELQADVMFLVDSSGSIGDANYIKMKTFMKNLVNKTEVGPNKVRFGVVQYSDKPNEEFQLDKHLTTAEILDAIDSMSYIGDTTYTGEALKYLPPYYTAAKGARSKVKQFLILITDGVSHDEVKTPADSLRDSGVIIFSIGVFNANKTQLYEISEKAERVFYLESFDTLKTIEEKLFFGICNPPEGYARDSIVNKSDIGPNNVQFGALKYSDDPTKLFFLNTYSSKLDIINAIQSDISKGGNTYTAKALNFSEMFFSEKHGSRRPKVPQFLIVITDGESHDRASLKEVSTSLQNLDITIFAIGIDKANTEELEIMAGTKGKSFLVDSFSGLNDIFQNVSQAVCNNTECKIEEADLVFLIDGSTSISPGDFEKMKKFMISVVYDFDIAPGRVHVGVAQYSDLYNLHFNVTSFMKKELVKNEIEKINQTRGNTHIGKALKETETTLFGPSSNSRIKEGVHQLLIVITDGKSQDDVSQPAQALRSKGIDIYALGIGDVDNTQLVQIAGSPQTVFSVANFAELQSIKRRIVRNICTPKVTANCSVDVVVGFDISTQSRGAALFHSQTLLENRLHDIFTHITSLPSASCTHGVKPQISLAFHVQNAKEYISPNFHIYSPDIVKHLKEIEISAPSNLDSNAVMSMWSTFQNANRAKMLLIFTDGLDEDTNLLQKTTEVLRSKGLNGVITVALEGTNNFHDIKHIEFGRGFNYMDQLHIGMSNIGEMIAKQMSHVVEKTCCCVLCTCHGERGAAGIYGDPGKRGNNGAKGEKGHVGEEGETGERGSQGLAGEQGSKGCLGIKGPKGYRGITGDRNIPGDPGLDGLPGEQGNKGHTGIKGEKGERGENGSHGRKGEPGHKGAKGLRGDLGEPGTDNTTSGPKGDKGDPGSEGEPGIEGDIGILGSKGTGSLPGRRGILGPKGVKGSDGEPGFVGDQGLKGHEGEIGIPGIKGEKGLRGPNGVPGTFGAEGSKGNPGNAGAKGKTGEPGELGDKGDPGPMGQRGPEGENGKLDYGGVGKRGAKGDRGYPGYSGFKGARGDPGVTGDPGKKGVAGRSVHAHGGGVGDPGAPGPQGRRGRKGQKGFTELSECDLINFVRNTCSCYQGKHLCPAYPTELVFALDVSADTTPKIFTKMKDIVTTLLENMTIRESNCPIGARVSVVSYNLKTDYLIRFSDFHHKEKLIRAVKDIALANTAKGHDIGGAMRFVARNIFKRSLKGATVRRIAVIFSSGPSNDVVSINTAIMEFSALGIIPVVIAFTPLPGLKHAFTMDLTGTFQLIDIAVDEDYNPLLKTMQLCTLCFDACKPDALCVESRPRQIRSYMDIAFLLDNSHNLKDDNFDEVKKFLSTVIDQLEISSEPKTSNTGDRMAIVTSSFRAFNQTPHVEFDLSTYIGKNQIKSHLKETAYLLRDPPAYGFSLDWTVDNIMSKVPNPRRNKVIIAILSGETSLWDKQTLEEASLKAKCQGYAIFVLSLGRRYNNTELTELASMPLDHHLLQLGRTHKPDLDYAVRFIQIFLNSVRGAINKYPSEELKSKCSRVTSLNSSRDKRKA
ncbi:collagen alpha-6(VI) chain-like [Spea bombifrons]|uniref:collagen alpha-6(VI) chain-like n=1 Tax=Spea bombifrons TaxID=233779 RepID=UPI0023496DF5|nr:collagen alpha-6(VI) chain-like [Spea bombifrons]